MLEFYSGKEEPPLKRKASKAVLRLKVLGILCLLCVVTALPAAADGGFSYTYDAWKTAVNVPDPYQAGTLLNKATDFGGKALSNPTDLFVSDKDLVYILDNGNSRVVVLDKDLHYAREICLSENGKSVKLQEAKGLFVTKSGSLYVADKAAAKVYIADADGIVQGALKAPPADKVEEGFEYTPVKVLVDSSGICYVLSANTYSGALQYDENGEFLGFYGSERVTVTPKLLWNEFWKRILSKEAASGLERNVPTSFINFDIDADNFVYTIKGGTGLGSGQIRKLNPQGTNILLDEEGKQAAFGDLDTYFDSRKNLTISTTFTDVTVDSRGFITAIDSTRNRLFQYDQSSTLLYTFGGSGTRKGCYQSPVAVDSLGDSLLVLDGASGSVTRSEPTAFGTSVRKAINLYEDGLYQQAMGPWQEILKMDASYEPANVGMSKIYEQMGDYSKAMEYARCGNSKSGYSTAFTARRDDWLHHNFAGVVIAVVLLMAVIVIRTNWQERHPKDEYGRKLKTWQYPFHCIFHPFKAYYEMKVDRKSNSWIAAAILAALFVVSILNSQLTGFHFNANRTDKFNVFVTLGTTVGLFLLFVLCNWAVSTLADGEGTFREIFNFTAYALLPYVIGLIVLTVLSNCLSLEEAAFFGIARVIVLLWTGVNLLMAFREVHQYTLGKTIWVLALNLLGMYLLLLIITIGYSMFTQLINFICMIYNELRLK